MIRVFPRRTKWTPDDSLAFVGDPPLFLPKDQPVKISVAFTWDIPEGERLLRAWKSHYSDVEIGGPAFDTPEGQFEPGVFLKSGVVITSRGCPNRCWFCRAWRKNGNVNELKIRDGWNLQDDNILRTSDEHFLMVMDMLSRQERKPVFSGGLEARALTEWRAEKIVSVKPERLYLAYDDPDPDSLEAVKWAAEMLFDLGISKGDHAVSCYVLIGFPRDTFEDAERRLREILNLGVMPMAMLYRNEAGKHDDPKWLGFQKRWARPWHYFLEKGDCHDLRRIEKEVYLSCSEGRST